jgi:hypothetical protein
MSVSWSRRTLIRVVIGGVWGRMTLVHVLANKTSLHVACNFLPDGSQTHPLVLGLNVGRRW